MLEGKTRMTPYDVLSVSPDASTDQVEKAWKAAVRANHPDLFDGAMRDNKSAYCARINAAYDQIQRLRASADAPHLRGARRADAAEAKPSAPAAGKTSKPRPAARSQATASRAGVASDPRSRRGDRESRFASWAASRSHDIDAAEYADLRVNAHRIIARRLGERLFRSLATALTFGVSDGRLSFGAMLRLPRFPNAFLPWVVKIEGSSINLFCRGVPLDGDTILVPRVQLVDGCPRLSRESFDAVTYRGWKAALTYKVCGTSQEGLDVSEHVTAPEGMPVRLFFLRDRANPTTRAAIATSPLLSLGLNWLYRLQS